MRNTGHLLITAVVYLGLCGCAAALPGTRVQDVLYNADGTRVEGTATIGWNGFTASDGSTLATSSINARIVQGVINVDLVPNENATPTGTSYQVSYLLDNGSRFFETWVVPESVTPVTVSQVRVTQPPPPGSVIAQSQVTSLVADLNGKADIDEENVFTERQTIEESSPGGSNALLSFRESGGPETVGFRLPTLTTSTLYTLPVSDGLPGQHLTTDGGGNMFWAAAGAGAETGMAYEIFQDAGTSVTQRNVANFSNGLTVFDNISQTRSEVEPVYGTTAGTITEGNDARLSDARTPLAHASTHATGGSDVVTPASIGALKNSNDTITSVLPGAAVLTIRGISGQSAPLQSWRDGNGDTMVVISPNGSTFVRQLGINSSLGGTVSNLFMQVGGLNRFVFSSFATVLNVGRYDDFGVFKDTPLQILRTGDTLMNTSVQIHDPTATTGTTTLSIKSGDGQGTTALQQWKNNANFVMADLDWAGNLNLHGGYIDFLESTAPPPPASNEVRLFVDSATGEISVKKDTGSVVSLESGAGGGGGSFGVFQDGETPSGTIDGVNDTFTLAVAPDPAGSLELNKNGVVQKPGVDFTLSSTTITFLAGAIPQTGDSLLAWYRSDGSAAGGDLTATYPNPVVSGIRGRVVSAAAPTDGQCLVWNIGTNLWEPANCARETDAIQWHFAGTPSTGLRPMTLTVPEGITGAALVDSRIVANTTGGASTFNIERCTASCTGTGPVFSSIYSADRALPLGTRTATGGTPTTATVNAGDQFRVNLVSVGSGVADVTVSLTYEYTASH